MQLPKLLLFNLLRQIGSECRRNLNFFKKERKDRKMVLCKPGFMLTECVVKSPNFKSFQINFSFGKIHYDLFFPLLFVSICNFKF
jgi:hypothetical protein